MKITNIKRNKRYQALAHIFSRVSVGTEFVTIGQAGEAEQRSTEIESKIFREVHTTTATTNLHSENSF